MTLELFPKHPETDAYRVGGAYQPYAVVGRDVRLTDGELAAEYWRTAQDIAYIVEGITWESMCDSWSIDEDEALVRAATLDRFATLPHYYE